MGGCYPRRVFWSKTDNRSSMYSYSNSIDLKSPPMCLPRSVGVSLSRASCNHIYHIVLQWPIFHCLLLLITFLALGGMFLPSLAPSFLRARSLSITSLSGLGRRVRLVALDRFMNFIHQFVIGSSWVAIHLVKGAEGPVIFRRLRKRLGRPQSFGRLYYQWWRFVSCYPTQHSDTPLFWLKHLLQERSWHHREDARSVLFFGRGRYTESLSPFRDCWVSSTWIYFLARPNKAS